MRSLHVGLKHESSLAVYNNWGPLSVAKVVNYLPSHASEFFNVKTLYGGFLQNAHMINDRWKEKPTIKLLGVARHHTDSKIDFIKIYI